MRHGDARAWRALRIARLLVVVSVGCTAGKAAAPHSRPDRLSNEARIFDCRTDHGQNPFRGKRPWIRNFVQQLIATNGVPKDDRRDIASSVKEQDGELVITQWTVDEPDDGHSSTDVIHVAANSLEAASLRWAPVSVTSFDLVRSSSTNDAPTPYRQALYIEHVEAWAEHHVHAPRGASTDTEDRTWTQPMTTIVIPIWLETSTQLRDYEQARCAAALDYGELYEAPGLSSSPDTEWSIYDGGAPDAGHGAGPQVAPAGSRRGGSPSRAPDAGIPSTPPRAPPSTLFLEPAARNIGEME